MKSRHALVLAAEVGLALVTLATVLGMERLFEGGGWLGPLAANAIAAHVVAGFLRRRGVGLPGAAVAMAVAAFVVTAWTTHWSTTTAGLPLGDTWQAMGDDLSLAWQTYQEVKAPAPVETGFVLASALAIWCIAYVADWAAFRLWVPFEATLPAGTLFLFTALLGVERGRGWAVGVYAGALIAFLLLHRMARQDGSSHWVAERRALGHRSLLLAGGGLGAVAVLVGTVFGPSVPGATSPGVIDAREIGDGGDSRVTVSPLVDIKSRLIEQPNVEVFTVRSDVRSYWRLTSLDEFDGQIWSSSDSYEEADDELPASIPGAVRTETFDQTYTIKALAALWLPNAFEPRALSVSGAKVLFEDASSTLIVDDQIDSSDGLVYRVTSDSPRLSSAEELAGLRGEIPSNVLDDNLDLPEDLSPRVIDLAREITAGADTPVEQARALQDHLRTFTYSLEVQRGHSSSAIEQFLFDVQEGYCEQFAGAFAAMARSLGIPSRVAVGFTPGEEDPDDPGLFRVRGEHAHAWPEVYLAGAGWVMFEPTPGRGAPSAESYTGVAEQQAAPGGGTGPTVSSPTSTPGTLPSTDSTIPSERPNEGNQINPTGTDTTTERHTWVDTALEAIAFVALRAGLVVLVALVVIPATLWLRRWRRRRAAETDLDHIELAWTEAVERATLVGYHEVASDTFPTRAAHIARALPSTSSAGARLAATVESASYSPEGPDPDDVLVAEEASHEIRAAAWEAAPWRARLGSWLDPRTVLNAWRADRRGRQRQITMTVRGDLEQERELVGTSEAG